MGNSVEINPNSPRIQNEVTGRAGGKGEASGRQPAGVEQAVGSVAWDFDALESEVASGNRDVKIRVFYNRAVSTVWM
ncbi:hypothetical protein HPP92_009583 [Vanilla planifolia]|uniref:Uncharacterized protein n=1 Tax=Vanilla planifolia TaxID=51239 RepID=A0A835RAV6_VANPL|nr:hypothetical protein HPP92_009583 [Vanilla planifolia]